jgi:hypothetical protein
MYYTILRRIIISFLALLIILSFTGCIKKELIFEKYANHINVVEDSRYGKIKMNFDKLDGEDIRSFKAIEGKKYEFEYEYNISSGDIKIVITNSNNIILAESKWKTKLEHDIMKDTDDPINVDGSGGVLGINSIDDKIRIVIIGKEATGDLKIER